MKLLVIYYNNYLRFIHFIGQSMHFNLILNILPFSVDATEESGKLGRLINHSRGAPNLEVVAVVQDGEKRLALLAAKTIKAGEELLYNYGETRVAPLSDHPWLLE